MKYTQKDLISIKEKINKTKTELAIKKSDMDKLKIELKEDYNINNVKEAEKRIIEIEDEIEEQEKKQNETEKELEELLEDL